MASLSFDSHGRCRLLFVDGDHRPVIRLGVIKKKDAETIKRHVEGILTSRRYGLGLEESTAAWLSSLDDEIYRRIAAVGLVAPRQRATLGEFIDSVLESRTDHKRNTKIAYKQGRRRMVDFFGDVDLQDVTEADAQAWVAWLLDNYSRATAGRCIRHAKYFFSVARKLNLIEQNPFVAIKAFQQVNPDNLRFINQATIVRCIAEADDEWPLIIALARYGGLRTPSEHLALTWADIHWQKSRFWVKSPKTEHHAGKEGRWVPLFPELYPFLKAAHDVAYSDWVINRAREPHVNWRTQFERIIKRSGVTPWPRLFQNLRASRETELASEYPLHVAAEWIGNSALVAARHYLTVRDEDYARACAYAPTDAHNAENGRNPAHNMRTKGGAVRPRKGPQGAACAAKCATEPSEMQKRKRKDGKELGATAIEHPQDSTGNSMILPFRGAHCDAQAWWDSLTVRQKAEVRRVVRKAG